MARQPRRNRLFWKGGAATETVIAILLEQEFASPQMIRGLAPELAGNTIFRTLTRLLDEKAATREPRTVNRRRHFYYSLTEDGLRRIDEEFGVDRLLASRARSREGRIDTRTQVVLALLAADCPLHSEELAAAVGSTLNPVLAVLKQLREKGFTKRHGSVRNGPSSLTEAGIELARAAKASPNPDRYLRSQLGRNQGQ